MNDLPPYFVPKSLTLPPNPTHAMIVCAADLEATRAIGYLFEIPESVAFRHAVRLTAVVHMIEAIEEAA